MLVSSLNCFPRIYEVSGPRHAIWASPTPSKPSRPHNVLFLLGKVNIEGLSYPCQSGVRDGVLPSAAVRGYQPLLNRIVLKISVRLLCGTVESFIASGRFADFGSLCFC